MKYLKESSVRSVFNGNIHYGSFINNVHRFLFSKVLYRLLCFTAIVCVVIYIKIRHIDEAEFVANV